jgi:hypothetical protein
LEDACAFRLLGPDMAYHSIDPHLVEGLKAFGEFRDQSDILFYRQKCAHFDLCFEDSWSGWFIADYLAGVGNAENDLVLIHADDHTDMMATLLVRDAEELTNPTTGHRFDPSKTDDWEVAIASGCVGIGDFITPFYYGQRQLHVRHVNSAPKGGSAVHSVTRAHCHYELIPDLNFAGVAMGEPDARASVGTYVSGEDADLVLHGLPEGHVIVHIDLDYFINDFNGNPGDHSTISASEAGAAASLKMKRFFAALHGAPRAIDRWIVATSPGFCSARHWPNLINQIQERIQSFSCGQSRR